jgi:ATP-dependent helicase/DNAse subunit B
MSKGNESSRRSFALIGFCCGLILTVMGLAVPAQAQLPVIDASSIAQASQAVQTAQKQYEQLQQMYGTVTGIANTIGKVGNPTLAFQDLLNQSGLSKNASPLVDLLNAAQGATNSVNGLSTLYSTISQQAQASGTAFVKPDFTSFSSAQNWVNTQLTVPANSNASSLTLARQARSLLASESATNAYAMALTARQQVSSMATTSQTLADNAKNSQDLRGDIAANTAVMLAMHDELAQVQALLAAILEVQSTAHLADSEPAAVSQTSSTSSN